MTSLRTVPSWRRHSTLHTPSAFRIEVKPPALRHAPVSWSQRLLFWLLAPAPQDAAPPINRLPGVKRDFLSCLDDVRTPTADALRVQVANSHSLRELWHLRAGVYNAVGRAHSESEAERRIQRLNQHFPTRSARPGMPGTSTP